MDSRFEANKSVTVIYLMNIYKKKTGLIVIG